jgi:hypothetical protein
MYATAQSDTVWKRLADERERTAKLLARMNAALVIAALMAGTFAFISYARVSDLCSSISGTTELARDFKTREAIDTLARDHCG